MSEEKAHSPLGMPPYRTLERRNLGARRLHTEVPSLVTTGLDPVVHAEVQRLRRCRKSEPASQPHGLPGQARQ